MDDAPCGGGSPVGDDWLGVTEEPLPVTEALAWAARPECGAVVTFCGTVRDHSEGRRGVSHLDYEAYLEQVEPRLVAVAGAARARWPQLGRVALLHRVGRLVVGEVSVVVVVSAPHRGEAFDGARYCIDTVKDTVPIWKRETWAGGSDWGLCARDVRAVDDLGAGPRPTGGAVRGGDGASEVRTAPPPGATRSGPV